MHPKKRKPNLAKRIASAVLIVALALPALFVSPQDAKAAVLEGSANAAYTLAMGRDKGFDGVVSKVISLSDGSFIAGGSFAAYNGQTARRLAKISASGTLDTDFNINLGTGLPTSNNVSDIALQPDGKLVIIGGFTTFNGVTTNRIMRLNADGTRDATFSIGTGLNEFPREVSVRSDGKIVVAGDFTSYNGTSINRIALLNADGSLDMAFRTALGTGPNALLTAAHVQPDRKIVISGNFTSVASTSVNRIARLNEDGSIDSAFVANVGAGIPSNAGAVITLSDGRILLGGSFTTFNGSSTARAVRLNSDGTINALFASGFNGSVYDFLELSNGQVMAAGVFSTYRGVTRRALVLMNEDLTADTAFSANIGSGFVGSDSVSSVIRLTDGSLVFAGGFSEVSARQMGNILKTDSAGVVDRDFDPNFGFGFNDHVRSAIQRPDGKIIYMGAFTRFSDESTRLNSAVEMLAQFDSANVLDTSFDTNIGTGFEGSSPLGGALQPDGKLVIMGGFTTFNGVTTNRIIRLNEDGTRDGSFIIGTGFNGSVSAVALQPDGKIIAGGNFTTYQGSSTARIARLNSDGSIDQTFRQNVGTGAPGTVSAIAVQSDGKIVLAGTFTTFNGVTVNRVVRLESDGTVDATFTSNAGTAFSSGGVAALALQSDGKILAVGSFTSYKGTSVGGVVRINSDGTSDADFNQNVGSGATGSGSASTVLVQRDGKVVVGGDFTVYKSVIRNRVVRLEANGTVDSTFSTNNGSGFNYAAYSLTLLNDNNILAGGNFTRSAGTYANRASLLLGPEMPPPDVPPPTDLDVSSDTGRSSVDNITSDTTPTFSGTASTSASVYLYGVATTTGLIGTATADGSGNYSVTSSPLADGTYSMVVVQELYGVRSATSSPINVTIDATAPSLFSLTPSNGATGVSVSSSLRIRLDESIATTSGTARLYRASDDFLVQSASTASSSVSIQSGHSLVFQPSQNLSYNTSYYVLMDAGVIGDIAGNQYSGLAASSSWAFTTSATPTPATPGLPDLSVSSDTGTSSTDNITSDATPTFTGSVSANALVYFYHDTSVLLGTTTANGSGSYAFTAGGLADGTYGITAVQEVLGMKSATSSSLSVTIDTAAPVLAFASPVDGSTSNSWNPSVNWGGSNSCAYSIDGSAFMHSACGQNGSDIPSPGIGNHVLVSRGTDTAGNNGYATSSFALAGTPPAISQVASTTAVTTATVSWTTDIPATSIVQYGLTTAYGSTTSLGISTSTSHSVGLSGLSPLTLYHFRVLSADEYGQTSTSSGFTFRTASIAVPSTPDRPDLDTASDTGVSNTDNVTSVVTPTFNGTSTPGALIYLYEAIGGTLLGTTTSDGSGIYSIVSAPMSNGVKGIAIVQELLGVRSATSTRLSVTIDADIPAPSVSSPADGSTVSAWNPSIDWGDATICEYSFASSSFMAVDCSLNGADIPDPGEGSHSFIVKATDQAGNEFQIYFIVTLQLPPIAIHAIASSTATTSALITWSTNNLSTSVVHYGTSSSYGSTTSLGATARNSHSVGIGGLLPSTLYYFQIQSTDQHGHSTSTVGLSFITKDIASSSGPGPEPDPGSDSGLSSTRPSGMQDGVGYNLGFRSYPTLTPEEIQRIFGLYLSAQATSAIPVSAAPAAAGTSSSAPLIYEFKRDLRVGLTGNDVKALQVFLNSNGYSVSASGVGSAGNETSYFGQATRAALARLQSSNGIRPAVGYFGQVTRAFVNGLMGIGR